MLHPKTQYVNNYFEFEVKETGTGLGLSVVKHIVKLHDSITYKRYTYPNNVGGITKTWTDSVSRTLNREPVELLTQDGSIRSILSLSTFNMETILGKTALDVSGTSHTLSDDVTVYLYNYNTQDYYVSSLSHVTAGDYSLTGYHDKDAEEGGRIQIILAC